MNTETANETVTEQQPAAEPQQPTDTTPPASGDQPAEPDLDDDDDNGDSNGEESGEEGNRRDKPKRPRWSDVNRANREALEARRELDELRRKLYEREQPPQQPTPPKVEATELPPSLEECDFDDQEHRRRTALWHQQQVAKEIERVEASKQSKASAQERQAAFAAKEAEFIAAHPDYEGVAKAPHVPITQQMVEIMMGNPDSAPAVAYYFGQNVDEAARIAQMPPLAAARAIGVIEARLVGPPKAPPPPKPVKPAPPVAPALQPGATGTKTWHQMSTEEHIREYQERRKAQGR
jgi:hypothetical protein